ncbi:chitinase-like protein 2 [Fagus crenata]
MVGTIDIAGSKKGIYERGGSPRRCASCNKREAPSYAVSFVVQGQIPFNPSRCCGGAISEYFQSSQFENIFSKCNSLEAHAVGFWDYHSFITTSAYYQPYGFGTTYMNKKFFGKKEVAAFLAHVGTKTSCEFRVSVF